MEENEMIARLVRRKLEHYFNKEIIEREFDPSGNGVHSTVPLVKKLELAYQAAIDKPYRSPKAGNRRSNEQPGEGTLTPRTKRDTKLKGRAQPQDILRLAKNSENTLNGLSIQDISNVHRFRCQSVPYKHVNEGIVPHISHHVHAYLNTGEALRYSQESGRAKRGRAQEYNKQTQHMQLNSRRQNNRWSGVQSTQSTLIDFRQSPLGLIEMTAGCTNLKPRKRVEGKQWSEPENGKSLMSNNSSSASSIRKFYVRKDSGTLPGDSESSTDGSTVITSTEPSSDKLGKQEVFAAKCSLNSRIVAATADGRTNHKLSQNQEVPVESDIEVEVRSKNPGGSEASSCIMGDHVGQDSLISEGSESSSLLENQNATSFVKMKGQCVSDQERFNIDSRSSLSPSQGRKRPQTARQHQKGSSCSTADTWSSHSIASRTGNSPSQGKSNPLAMVSTRNQTSSRSSSVTPDIGVMEDINDLSKVLDGRDRLSEKSCHSIGDALGLIDESSFKSLSIGETSSGSYSLDFEDEGDESSTFDNVSYESRTRGRNGGIAPPGMLSVSSRNSQGSRTEEYIRTESLVSLR